MKVERLNKGTTNEILKISDIKGDMGGQNTLSLLQQPDGDVILSMHNELGYVEMSM